MCKLCFGDLGVLDVSTGSAKKNLVCVNYIWQYGSFSVMLDLCLLIYTCKWSHATDKLKKNMSEVRCSNFGCYSLGWHGKHKLKSRVLLAKTVLPKDPEKSQRGEAPINNQAESLGRQSLLLQQGSQGHSHSTEQVTRSVLSTAKC